MVRCTVRVQEIFLVAPVAVEIVEAVVVLGLMVMVFKFERKIEIESGSEHESIRTYKQATLRDIKKFVYR